MAFTDIDNPELYFQTKLYTGNGTAIGSGGLAVTLDGDEDMQPDLVWIKNRDGTDWHDLYDSVRGVTKRIYSNDDNAENTNTESLTAFGTNGFTVGNAGDVNTNTNKHVAWNWKAGGSTSSNSNGSITSSVSVNTTAGFSIVSYTGNGSDGATLGHSLGTTPEMVIQKRRSGSTASWVVWHKSIHDASSNDKVIYLNLTNATASGASDAIGGVSSTLITTKGTGAVNPSANTCIAYCFASIQGFSKFGTYDGNGNANGPFIYTGFKPATIIFKDVDGTNSWRIGDAKRIDAQGGNSQGIYSFPDTTAVEQDSTSRNCDYYSNGFKIMHSDSSMNGDGVTYMYAAWAESPFVNSNGIPTTAR